MPETPRQSVSILIVDDEPEIRSILSDLLCKEFDCTLAASAEEALDALAANPFDLVLSDINLRGMSGLQLVPLVRVCAPDCVVIMISGMQTMESAIDALRVGAFDYIMKPFDLRQVEAAVRRALQHRSLLISKRLYENY
ncbi:MAG: response regulator, partial [Pyrinomonadaceae bacterium]